MSLDHEALMKTSNDHHRRLSSLSSLDDPLVSFFEGSASPKDLGIQHSPSKTKRARAKSVANGAISLTATVLEENGRLQLELQRLRTPSSSSSPSSNPTFKRHVAEIQRLREELSVTETQLQVTAMQLEEATLMHSPMSSSTGGLLMLNENDDELSTTNKSEKELIGHVARLTDADFEAYANNALKLLVESYKNKYVKTGLKNDLKAFKLWTNSWKTPKDVNASNENQNNNELSRLRQTLSVTEMHLENSTT